MTEIRNITSLKYDKNNKKAPDPVEAWDKILNACGYTKADEILSRNCQNRKRWFFILFILNILIFLGVVAFAIYLFVFGGSSSIGFVFAWVFLFIALLGSSFSTFFFRKKTNAMLIENNIGINKIRTYVNDSIFHEAILSQIDDVTKGSFCKKLNDKFSSFITDEDELNHDVFLPLYMNKRNAILHSFHKTIWLPVPYMGSRTRTVGKTTTVKTVTVLWPAPFDNQYTCITDVTGLSPDLTFHTINKTLNSKRAIEKFNNKNSLLSLENNEFNQLFPSKRNDEQGFRVLFDLITQENFVKVYKEIGNFGAGKENKYLSVFKFNELQKRTFAPSHLLASNKFYREYKKQFFYYFNTCCSDFINLIGGYLSFSCFSLENEKKYEPDQYITDLELESILYSVVKFPHAMPPKSKRSTIHHFHFKRGYTSKLGILDLTVHDDQMYSVPKTVMKEGVAVIVDDYHYSKQQYQIFLYKGDVVKPNSEQLPPEIYFWNNIVIFNDTSKLLTADKVEAVLKAYIK